MDPMPLLSIGMIFKDEERCLERCLKSLQPLREAIPCELVMADTGAEDGSRAIAARYADELFDFAWVDDFSAARNAVMDRCHGRWYFSVDCDEWLDPELAELLAFLKKDTASDSAFVIVRNYEDDALELSDAYDDFRALRLLRMDTGRRFWGAIHENFGYREPAVRLTHTILHHDGYVYGSPEAKKKKQQRNMKLLAQKLEQQPEDLRTLLQCVESGKGSPDLFQYVRRGVAAVQKKCPQWEIYGSPILRYAVELTRAYELPEMRRWAEYAETEFPDSIFSKVDLNRSIFLAACDAKEWEKAIRYGEGYRKGLTLLRNANRSQKTEAELGHSSLLFGSRAAEQDVLIGLANAYLQAGKGKAALKLLAGLEGEALSPEQVRSALTVFCQLHAQTALDTAPAFVSFYTQIKRPKPGEPAEKARPEMFSDTAAASFAAACQREEQERKGYHRPGYTAFACLADQCEAGRGAKIMMTDDPAEMRPWLEQVEDWQALPIEALEHALQAGVSFPLADKPLPQEVVDGLASRLTHDANPARQMALALPENAEFESLQSLYWAQALVLAALHSFDWSLGKASAPVSKFACPEKKKDEKPDERPKDTPEVGLALIRRFAQVESVLLPLLYTPQMLTEQNAALLPPMHRWGLYCAWAFAALDAGQPQEYLATLRQGLAACPGQKEMVQFLLDRFLEDTRPKTSPELLILAEKIRAILAVYDPNDPAVQAIRESPAYKQVAWIIEPPTVTVPQ